MNASWFIAWCLLSYALGCISWSHFLVRQVAGKDLRQHGSGNLGATNAGRVLGMRWAALIYVLDLAKGMVAVGVPPLAWSDPSWRGFPVTVAAGLLVTLGHIFPFYLGFRGGKGVATGSGVVFALSPMTGIGAVLVWGVVVIASRMVSLASILAAMSLPLVFWVCEAGHAEFIYRESFFAAVSLLVVVMHRSNVARIIQGKESKIGRTR